MEDQSIQSKNEIILIKDGNIPEKVIDEGDSLGIGCTIHSFYWPYDYNVKPKKDDYEPIAFSKVDNTYLTRLHYRGLIIWQGCTLLYNKPVVYFRNLVHTPVLCSIQRITYSMPDNTIDRMILEGYLVPKLQKMKRDKQHEYKVNNYSDKLVVESVPEESRFTWDKVQYYILVAPVERIEQLTISNSLREKLHAL